MLKKTLYLLAITLSTNLLSMEPESDSDSDIVTEQQDSGAHYFKELNLHNEHKNALMLALENGDQNLIDLLLNNQELYNSKLEDNQASKSNKSEKEAVIQTSNQQPDKSGKLEVGFPIEPILSPVEQAKKDFEDSLEQIRNSSNIQEKAEAVVENFVAYNSLIDFDALIYKKLIHQNYLSMEDFKALNKYALIPNSEKPLQPILLIKFLAFMNKLDVQIKDNNGDNLLTIAQKSSSSILKNLVKEGYDNSKPFFQKALAHMPWKTTLKLLFAIYVVRKLYNLELDMNSVKSQISSAKATFASVVNASILNSPHKNVPGVEGMTKFHKDEAAQIISTIKTIVDHRFLQMFEDKRLSSCNIV